MANGGGTDGRMEIPPCVLQDIGPLGPLPKKGTDQLTNRPTDRHSRVYHATKENLRKKEEDLR